MSNSHSSSGSIKQTIPSPFTRGFRAASASNAALQSLDTNFLRKALAYLLFYFEIPCTFSITSENQTCAIILRLIIIALRDKSIRGMYKKYR